MTYTGGTSERVEGISREERNASDAIDDNMEHQGEEEEEEELEDEEMQEEEEKEEEEEEEEEEEVEEERHDEEGNEEATEQTSNTFFRKFGTFLEKKISSVFQAAKKFNLETLRKYDKKVDKPGVMTFVVSPQGGVDCRITPNLNSIPIIRKYACRMAWALTAAMQDRAYGADEEDLGVVDKDSLPPELAKNTLKKSKQRKTHFNRKLKVKACEIIKKKKVLLGLARYDFCLAKDRLVCTAAHGCAANRVKWGWPEAVPFISTTNMSQSQLQAIIEHYADLVPGNSGTPTQGLHPRYGMLFICCCLQE